MARPPGEQAERLVYSGSYPVSRSWSSQMTVCPSCGVQASADARFCAQCGSTLPTERTVAQQRKIVTTLFCDIVGFTALSEQADPEDVDALLRGYNDVARAAIESHGGTVEKFIGDAVVGVFGVPIAHEDDPERAVRAGLRLVEDLGEAPRPDGSSLQVRVGINSGEVLVRLDVAPGSGVGFLTGDAVNTAARLQTAAPPSGVVVGAATQRLSAKVIEYRRLAPVQAKGKSEPVAAWLALGPVSNAETEQLTPLVGREVELSYLRALCRKCLSSRSPQFVLVVGEPGIGKTRLVSEFGRQVRESPEGITWLQGRCPPFGEGVTFLALEEIARQYLGVSDGAELIQIDGRLEPLLPVVQDREWVRQRLHALLGFESPQAAREENFAAWLRFLEDRGAAGSAVLVFEDLHWADEALLAFLEHLASHLADVPVMILATARPELFESHPQFAATAPRVNRIALEPLSEAEMHELVGSLIEVGGEEERVVQTIMRRAEGNPFYAEESARLLSDNVASALDTIEGDRGPQPHGETQSLMPAAVHAVLAARLDALPADQKEALCDASVVGDRFRAEAVAAVSREDVARVRTILAVLVARQLVRRVRADQAGGDEEYGFRHALIRDVAYGQLTRGVRAAKHADVAVWMEARGPAGTLPTDDLELIAEHYATAFELARACGDQETARRVSQPTIRCLAAAGERVASLDAAAAERHYTRALELATADDPVRARLLVLRGTVLHRRGRYAEAAEVLQSGVDDLLSLGDRQTAVLGMGWRASSLSEMCDERYGEVLRAACDLLEDDGPSQQLSWALMGYGLVFWGDGHPQMSVEIIDRAIAMSRDVGVAEPVDLIGHLAAVRCQSGDLGGFGDYRRARALAEAQGLGSELVLLAVNFADNFLWNEGPRASLGLIDDTRDLALRRGLDGHLRKLEVLEADHLSLTGRWDEALERAAARAPALENAHAVWDLILVRALEASCWARRGRVDEAEPAAAWLLRAGRDSRMTFVAARCLFAAAEVAHASGDRQEALELLRVWAARPSTEGFASQLAPRLPEGVRIALALDNVSLAKSLSGGIHTDWPLDDHARTTITALLAEAGGDYQRAAVTFADAAQRWHDFGVPYEEAQALLGQGRCLLALGTAEEAAGSLTGAREVFEHLGARPALVETEELLATVARLAGEGPPERAAPRVDLPQKTTGIEAEV